MAGHKCFECGFESLGYCSARRNTNGRMLPIIEDKNGCEMYVRVPSDREIEEVEKRNADSNT